MPEITPRVLVADASLPNRRLIRELLTAFRHCEVDDAANAEHAFERALQREYALLIFAIDLPDLSGILLDRFLAKVYPKVHPEVITAPPVIFLARPEDASAFRAAQSDARVRGSVPLPLNLDALMNAAGTVLPAKDPTSAG
ncbi:MAG TPA: response regulator [Candidatus Saccharimonadia bacterium]|nr:response regulator [Candidatus Saccharimonadia bacterium]